MIIKKKITWSMSHAWPKIHGHNWTVTFEYEGMEDPALLDPMEDWLRMEWEDKTLINVNHLALTPYLHADNQFDPEIEEIGFIPVPFEPSLIGIARKLHIQASQMFDLDPYRLTVELRETEMSSIRYYLEDLGYE